MSSLNPKRTVAELKDLRERTADENGAWRVAWSDTWLDGSLNLLAGLESIRRIKDDYGGRPPVTVRLVDWADEEGARFGRSLFGSSACSGSLVPDEERGRSDKDGILVKDALARCGGTWTGCSSRAASSSTPPPTWSCTSNRVRSSRAWGCRSGWCRAPSGWSATASTSAARPPTPAPPPWTAAATPSWRRRA